MCGIDKIPTGQGHPGKSRNLKKNSSRTWKISEFRQKLQNFQKNAQGLGNRYILMKMKIFNEITFGV